MDSNASESQEKTTELPLEEIEIHIDENQDVSGSSINLTHTENDLIMRRKVDFGNDEVYEITENINVNVKMEASDSEQCSPQPVSFKMQERTTFSPDADTEYQNVLSLKITHPFNGAEESGYQSPYTNVSPSNFTPDSEVKNKVDLDNVGKFNTNEPEKNNRADNEVIDSYRELCNAIVIGAISSAQDSIGYRTPRVSNGMEERDEATSFGNVTDEPSFIEKQDVIAIQILDIGEEIHDFRKVPHSEKEVSSSKNSTNMDSCSDDTGENVESGPNVAKIPENDLNIDTLMQINIDRVINEVHTEGENISQNRIQEIINSDILNTPSMIQINLEAKSVQNSSESPRNFECNIPSSSIICPDKSADDPIKIPELPSTILDRECCSKKPSDEISATLSFPPSKMGKPIEYNSAKPPSYNQERRHVRSHRHHRHRSEHKDRSDSVSSTREVVGHCTSGCPTSWSSSSLDSLNLYPNLTLNESLAMSSKMLLSYVNSLKKSENYECRPYGQHAFDRLVHLVKQIVCKDNQAEPNNLPLDLNRCKSLQQVLEQELHKFSETDLVDELGRSPRKSEITVVVSNRKT